MEGSRDRVEERLEDSCVLQMVGLADSDRLHHREREGKVGDSDGDQQATYVESLEVYREGSVTRSSNVQR